LAHRREQIPDIIAADTYWSLVRVRGGLDL
jgi:hypothetical protein